MSPPPPSDAFTTHDGRIFTCDRHQMADAAAIAARMAGDMARQARARGFWELAQLEADGWTPRQVEQHWRAALAVYRARRAGAEPELPQTPGRTVSICAEIIDVGANVLALTIFLGAIFVIGGVL